MSTPVSTVDPSDTLHAAQVRMSGTGISSLAVVDPQGDLVGVISMTDLIRVGRRQAGSRSSAALLTLPEKPVSDRMTKDVVTVAPADTLASAAERMVKERIHRVYVVEDQKLRGVLSTRDVMLAIRDKPVRSPIEEWMSTPPFTIRAHEPVSLAAERLEKAHVTGLIVLEESWPIGLFTQREALESRDQSRDTPVESVMNSAMLILEQTTPLHRAAAQAAALQVQRVIAVKSNRVVGILTGLDFARAAV
jgi:CBS domain-containing protein